MEDNGSGLYTIREGRYLYGKRKAGMNPALLLEFKVWEGKFTVLNIYLERQKYTEMQMCIYTYTYAGIYVLYIYTWINFLALSTKTAWEQCHLS